MAGITDQPSRLDEVKKMVSRWSKTGLLKKLSNRKATTMAQLLQSEAVGLKALNEISQVGDIAGFNKIAFPLVRRVFAQLIANEIVSVQPMSLPSGLLFYLDFYFDRTKSGFYQGGSVYGIKTAVTNQQLQGVGAQSASAGFYDLTSGYSTRMFALSNGNGSSSAIYIGKTSTSPRVSGTLSAFAFNLSNSAVADLAQLQNFRVALSGTLNYDNLTFRGASSVQSLSADTISETIDPAYTSILSAGTVVIYSTTNFVQIAATGGVQEYVVIGPMKTDVQDNPKGTNLGDMEAISGIPEVNVSISSVPVMAETRKLKTKWTPELAQDLNAYHALDAEVELTTILSELIALEIDREILGELLHGAVVRAAWSRKIGRYLSLSADGISVTVNTFTNASQASYQSFYGTQQDWYQTLGEVVTTVSNEIHKRSLRHGANFIVTSPEISSVLESINGWKPTVLSDASEVEYSLGLEKAGSLSNRYTVYKDPYFPADRMLLGYKGGSFLETGFVYAPYVPLLVTQTIFEPENFTPRKGVMTRYAKQMVRPEFYGTIQVFDLDWIGVGMPFTF